MKESFIGVGRGAEPELQPIRRENSVKTAIVGKIVSYYGPKSRHRVGARTVEKGRHYKFESFSSEDQALMKNDPHIVVEDVNEDGQVIVSVERMPRNVETAKGFIPVSRNP